MANLHGREKFIGALRDKPRRPCDMRSAQNLWNFSSGWPPWIANVCCLSSLLSNAAESSFSGSILLLIISATFWSSYCEICAKRKRWPICQILSLASKSFDCGPKNGQFVKHWHSFVNHRYQLTLWCLPPERHFEAVTVKLSLNVITTKEIADFQNSVTRL